MRIRYRFALAAAAAALILTPFAAARATPPSQTGALDESTFSQICFEAESSSSSNALDDQCQAGADADAPSRNAAISGNNLGITGTQGSAIQKVQERLEQLREGEQGEGGGAAMDWAIGRLGLYITGNGQFSERDSTALEIGNDARNFGISGGADWRFSDRFVGGLNLAYNASDIDFTGNAGELDVDDFSFTFYGSWTPTDAFYLDAYAGYGIQDYDGRRNIVGVPTPGTTSADFDGDEFRVGGNFGYDFYRGAWSYGPYGGLTGSFKDVDSYSETGTTGFELDVESQDVTSFQSNLGLHAAYAWSTDFGVVVPDARVEWVHEFEDDSRDIASNFSIVPTIPFLITTDDPDRNFGRFGASVAAILPEGWIAFADYEYQFAHSFLSYHQVTLGLRIEF